MKKILIRQETKEDYALVYQLIKAAFQGVEHSDGTEQHLVASLRKSVAFVPELSLVAEINGQIVGHILFTEARVGADTVLALAPISVSPAFQRQGVGTALITQGHTLAKKLGYSHSLVLGSEKYYPRFGYLPAREFHIQVPPGMPPANFMACSLQTPEKSIGGAVTYAPEFGI